MSELEKIREEITTYLNSLNELKTKLEDEKKKLDTSKRKDKKREERINATLSKIEEEISSINSLKTMDTLRDYLESIITTKNEKDKNDKLNLVTRFFTTFKNRADEAWKEIASEFEDKDLNDALEKIDDEIQKLNARIAHFNELNVDTKEECEKLKSLINKKTTIKRHLISEEIDLDELNKLINGRKGQKAKTFETFNTIIDEIELLLAQTIINQKMDLDKEKAKIEAKSLLEKISEKLQAHPYLSTIASIILVGSIILTATKGPNNDTKHTYEPTPTPKKMEEIVSNPQQTDAIIVDETNEIETNKQIDDLVALGYNNYYAKLMVENFSKENINEIITNEIYNERIEDYATVNEFEIENLNDYIIASNLYKAEPYYIVDCVNRAKIIQEMIPISDITTNDLVDMLLQIAKHDIKDISVIEKLINLINKVTQDYLFGAVTKEDVATLDSLPHLFGKDTDEYNFTVKYVELLKAVIKEPNNEEARQKLISFIRIFAENKANARYNEPGHLSNDENINAAAIVIDNKAWIGVFKLVINPTLAIGFENVDEEARAILYVLYTGLESINSDTINSDTLDCGSSRTLGGN